MKQRDIKTTERIMKIVTKVTGVNKTTMLQFSRNRKITDARKIAMHLMREYTILSYTALGIYFDRRPEFVYRSYRISKLFTEVDPAYNALVVKSRKRIEAMGFVKIEGKKRPAYNKRTLIIAA